MKHTTKIFSFNTGRKYAADGQLIGCHATLTDSDEWGDWWEVVFIDTSRGITGKLHTASHADEDSVMQGYDKGGYESVWSKDPRLVEIRSHLNPNPTPPTKPASLGDTKMLIVPTIHEYRKANIVEATDLVVQEAIKLGLVPLDFNVTLRITDKSSITGGVDKHGTPRITMSTHDRYHNVHNYIQSWMFSRNMKKSWLLAAQEYRNTGRCTSVEYASFTQDKEIGNLYTDNNWLILLSATCHEVAHAITISNHRTHPMTSTKPKPHGVEWKDVYRALRNALVNPVLKTDTVTPPTTVKPVKPAKTIRAKKPVRKDGIKSTREGSVMYAIIQALLIGGTIKQLAETCGVQKGNISASVNSHIPKKGYVIRLKDGVYKITNATKVW